MAKWMLKRNRFDTDAIAKSIGQSGIVVDILASRGVYEKDEIKKFLEASTNDMADPSLMCDMGRGVEIVSSHIKKGSKIAIYGDYDVDGIMSCYILYRSLKNCGADVMYYIPHRELEGYGMNVDSVNTLAGIGVNLILTCDNGISSIEPIKTAKANGMDVVVTDHHELAFDECECEGRREIMPCADAIINPKRPDCKYPFKLLCAGAIAYKFAAMLYKEFGIPRDQADEYIEYAAIATVCDVVDLVGENRIIAKNGIEMLRSTKNIGLNALIVQTGIEREKIGTYHIGFILGPCINATGRLERATIAMELLLCENEQEASLLAKKLVDLNEDRKRMTESGVESVKDIIEKSGIKDDRIIVAVDSSIHESIAGIVAGRIKEQYHLPTIILTRGKEMLKGSGRSIESYNMFEGLVQCKDLISRFGGHPMAAGLSVEEENVDSLRVALNENCTLSADDMERVVRIDKRLSIGEISYDLVEQIKKLEPFGKGNSAPLFAEKGILVKNVRFLGKNESILKMVCGFGSRGREIEAISFDGADKFKKLIFEQLGEKELKEMLRGKATNLKMDMVYTVGINEYMGSRRLQLTLRDFRMSVQSQN